MTRKAPSQKTKSPDQVKSLTSDREIRASFKKGKAAIPLETKENLTKPTARKSAKLANIAKNLEGSPRAIKNINLAPSSRALPAKITSVEITQSGRGSRARVSAQHRPQQNDASACRIFQIYFEPWQLELLDPAFEPFDNRGIKSEYLEFEVFERIFATSEAKTSELWGALSWRFAEKTGMSGADLISEIASHPGYDVYYCNPYPHNEALFHNMWLQGETVHPRFLEVASAVFEAAGLAHEDLSALQRSETYSAANYFVASEAFWKAYIPFVRRVMGLAETKMSKSMRQLLHSSDADHRNMHSGASYVSFIVERLFPIFMKTSGRRLKGYKIPLQKHEKEMNIHLRLLREMKDIAHQTNSAWLAACWVNYRNLYFSQTNGPGWCSDYLRRITPPSIHFG
jgi:hypothetical protein